jgi:site-specific DNA-cytosine methylase
VIQDCRPRDKAQNGRGWNDDGVSYTVDTANTQAVAYNVHGGNANAKERHAYETDVARCIDRTGGFAPNQGGTVVGVDLQNTAIGGDVAGTLDTTRPGRGGGQAVMAYGGGNCSGPIDVATACLAHPQRQDFDVETFIAHTLRAEGHDASEDGTGRGVPLIPIPFDTTQITSSANRSNPQPGDPCHPMAASAHAPSIASRQGVRRLTPREMERLQGFPDLWTLLPVALRKPIEDEYAAYLATMCPDLTREELERLSKDGPRAKALGNSMAVPVLRWIGERLLKVDALR